MGRLKLGMYGGYIPRRIIDVVTYPYPNLNQSLLVKAVLDDKMMWSVIVHSMKCIACPTHMYGLYAQ